MYRLLIEQVGADNQGLEQCPPTVLSGSSWLGVTAFCLLGGWFSTVRPVFPSIPSTFFKYTP